MTIETVQVVPIGTEVTVRGGIPARIEGYGEVLRNTDGPTVDESERVTVYEVEVIENHVGAGDKVTLEGERMLLYREAFEVKGEYLVKLNANIRTIVTADGPEEALEQVREAISSLLTWDGDEDAPMALEQLELRFSGGITEPQ